MDVDRQLGSKYLLGEVIGRGAMGEVFKGTARDSGDPVAIKILRPELVSDREAVARFMQERQILTSISSPATVRVIDLVAEGQTLAIVMELISGQDLRRYLRAQGTLPPAEAVGLAVQLLSGLAAVHAAGVVHRDIKPENLLLDTSAGRVLLKVTDFGVARLSYGASLTKLSSLIGTPEYMAPELAEGGSASPAADLYSAGIVLYEMLSGRTPFAGGPPMTVLRRHADMAPPPVPGIPPVLWDQLSRMLAKDPTDRPASAAEAAEALAEQSTALAALPALPPMTEPVSYQRAADDPISPDGHRTTVVRHRDRGVTPAAESVGPSRGRGASASSATRWRRGALLAGAAAVIAASAIALPSWLHHGSARASRGLITAKNLETPRAAVPAPQPSGSSPSATRTTKASAAPGRRQAAAGTVGAAAPDVTQPQSSPMHAAPRPTQAAPAPAQPSPSTAPAAASYASAPLATSSSSVTARVYFGQLSAVVGALAGQVTLNTPANWVATEPGRCAATVVFSGVTSPTGAVYALGLASGWAGLEYAPSQDVEGGNLHQQLVTPPATVPAGESWQASAKLVAGNMQLTPGTYALQFQGNAGSAQTWMLDDQAVSCGA